MFGDRVDLVCAPGTSHEVWATLRPGTIAVGSGSKHVDFERFGRNISDEEIASQALGYFRELLANKRLIPTFHPRNEP